MQNTFIDAYYSQPDEYDTFEYNGSQYKIKWYGGTLFATEDLSDEIINEETGYGRDDRAIQIDDKIAYYFSTEEFDGKSGKELWDWLNKDGI